ncbi:MAG: cupin domain-containing protein [Rhodospirillales bacterium]|nr:cupin domain-containing protein [Rhodospirillales bacterium]
MPFYDLDDIPEELVTPKHSTALGRLITGEQVEFGILRFKAGEGAKMHSHPHEQVVYMLRGRMRVTLDSEVMEIGPGQAALFPSNAPHKTDVLEDAEVVSVKGIVGGVGHRI